MTGSCCAVQRLKLGPIDNPIRGALHGSAACTALGASSWLLTGSAQPAHPIAIALFALTHAALYATSSLYHTVPWRPAAKARMQRLDHAMIYVAIAGSVSAIALLGTEGGLRVGLLLATWLVALGGAARKLFARSPDERLAVPLQTALACLALPALPSFAERFPGAPTLLIVTGALCFALGAVCFVTRRPVLWPRVFSFHEVFHVCTVLGSGAHALVFVRYLGQVG